MAKLNVGDMFILTADMVLAREQLSHDTCGGQQLAWNKTVSRKLLVKELITCDAGYTCYKIHDAVDNSGGKIHVGAVDAYLFTSNQINPMANEQLTIPQKFALALKSEPQKSFRKMGITNGDDLLTPEGQTIFLTWLLDKHAAAFKTEVVDPLVAEEKKSCSK